MPYTEILRTVSDGICWLFLNRPKVLNALSPGMVMELKHALEEAARDESIGVVVVGGEGRAFSAGVDLKEMNATIQGGKFSQDEILTAGLAMIENIQTMPKPCIAMVHGHCYTGALELALAFDLMYVSEDCKLGDTHSKWGILPKWGMSQRLSQKAGIMRAREMSFTAKTITGKEAEEYGIANKAVPADKLKEYTEGIAREILKNSRQTVAAFKHLYHRGSHTTLQEGLRIEAQFDTDITDRAEFLRGFLQNK
jgi:enoyl-CoA hydratase/carnithine racemase